MYCVRPQWHEPLYGRRDGAGEVFEAELDSCVLDGAAILSESRDWLNMSSSRKETVGIMG